MSCDRICFICLHELYWQHMRLLIGALVYSSVDNTIHMQCNLTFHMYIIRTLHTKLKTRLSKLVFPKLIVSLALGSVIRILSDYYSVKFSCCESLPRLIQIQMSTALTKV